MVLLLTLTVILLLLLLLIINYYYYYYSIEFLKLRMENARSERTVRACVCVCGKPPTFSLIADDSSNMKDESRGTYISLPNEFVSLVLKSLIATNWS